MEGADYNQEVPLMRRPWMVNGSTWYKRVKCPSTIKSMPIAILLSSCNIARCKFDISMPPHRSRRLEKNLLSRTEFYRREAAAVSAVRCSFALLSAITRRMFVHDVFN